MPRKFNHQSLISMGGVSDYAVHLFGCLILTYQEFAVDYVTYSIASGHLQCQLHLRHLIEVYIIIVYG